MENNKEILIINLLENVFGDNGSVLSGGCSIGDFGGSISWAIFLNTFGSQ